jgi:hypothetical protein
MQKAEEGKRKASSKVARFPVFWLLVSTDLLLKIAGPLNLQFESHI